MVQVVLLPLSKTTTGVEAIVVTVVTVVSVCGTTGMLFFSHR